MKSWTVVALLILMLAAFLLEASVPLTASSRAHPEQLSESNN